MSASVSAIGASGLLQYYLAQSTTQESYKAQKSTRDLDILASRTSTLTDLEEKLSGLGDVLSAFKSSHSSPFHSLSQITSESSEAFGAEASITAASGSYSVQTLRLASSDTRVSKIYDAGAGDLASFFGANGSQTFSINVASPGEADPDNREDVAVTVNPTGSTNRSVLNALASGINSAMSAAVDAGTISSQEAAVASVVESSEGDIRLSIRSGKTGFTNRLDLSDSADGLLATLEINKNAVVDASRVNLTPASLTGTAISGPFVVDASNNTLDIDVNGTTVNAVLTAGTYITLDDLATEVETQIGAAVTVEASGGALKIETVDKGASTSLEVAGGTALELLGLGTNAASASLTGTAITGPIVIDNDNQTIEIEINGSTEDTNLSKSTYSTLAELAAELEDRIGSDLVSVSVENNALKIETVATGEQASIKITGGDALEALGFRSLVTSATLTGNSLSGPVTVITNRNDQLRLKINGGSETVRVAGGTYSNLADVAAEIENDIGSDKVNVTVSNNAITIETLAGGSSASIEITGGDIVSTLGFSVMSDPVTGSAMTAVTGSDADPIDAASGTDLSTSENLGDLLAVADADSGGMLRDVGTNESNSLLNSAVDIDGLIYYSETNDITDALEGVAIRLHQKSTAPEALTVEKDSTDFIEDIQRFVTAYNETLSQIKTHRDELGSNGLKEDALLEYRYDAFRRQLREDLASGVENIPTTFKRLSDIGFSVRYDGTLALADEGALTRALETNPTAVENLLNSDDGVFTRLQKRVSKFSSEGALNQSRSLFSSKFDSIQAEISTYRERLDSREEALRKDFDLLQERLSFFQRQQETIYALIRTGLPAGKSQP